MSFFESLLTQSSHTGPSPELLETLGHKAATAYLREGRALNETIHELVRDQRGIGNEHIKRISEFANNAVFQERHSTSEDKNVHFPIADPGVILRDLRDGGAPAHEGQTLSASPDRKTATPSDLSDYAKPPTMQGFSTHSGEPDLLGTLFGDAAEAEKTAASASRHARPIDDVFDDHLCVRAARDKIASVHEQFDLAYKAAQESFYREARRECLDPDGLGLAGVTQAVKLATQSLDPLTGYWALRPVVERLVSEGVVDSASMDKTACARAVRHRIPNDDHPLLTSLYGMLKAAQEQHRAATSLAEADHRLTATTQALHHLCR